MNSKRITLRINAVTIFLKFVSASKFSVTRLPNNISSAKQVTIFPQHLLAWKRVNIKVVQKLYFGRIPYKET